MNILYKTIIYRFYSFSIIYIFLSLTSDDFIFALFGALSIELLKLIQYFVFEYFWNKL